MSSPYAPEPADSFAARVKDRSGLAPYAIPRVTSPAPDGVAYGATIAKSPHGRLVFFDFVGEDADGRERFARCAIVDPSPEFEARYPAAPGVVVENDDAGVFPGDGSAS